MSTANVASGVGTNVGPAGVGALAGRPNVGVRVAMVGRWFSGPFSLVMTAKSGVSTVLCF